MRAAGHTTHLRRLECQSNQQPYQDTVYDMNDDIDQVIAEYVQTAKMVIQGKREFPDIPYSLEIREFREVSYPLIFNNLGDIIKVEWGCAGIRIRQKG